ncbi:MAG TPA: extensin family protein [Xanthobacteraceae bacterium]|jgi:hypothetical protein
MTRGLRSYLFGAVAIGTLGLLAGCGGHHLFAEREPWRHEAELQCMNSGAVKEGPGKVRISPIDGPGICGADFPMKVSSFGDSVPMSYSDELRPPAAVPTGPVPPRWPIVQPPPAATAVTRNDLPAPDEEPDDPRSRPASRKLAPPAPGAGSPEPYDFRKPYQAGGAPSGRTGTASASPGAASPYDFSPEPYDRRQVVGARSESRYIPPPPPPPPVTAAIGPVAVSPAATLACPIISALDQWISEAVQPAAMKWFGMPVVEIKQISAYSCRGMNGDPNATISEHAFGNALDIAAFTLADGRKIDVQHGWHGAPEEQAFLHDVQATACEQFTTVLAPGSNAFHYNHIHVDLMRRRNDRHACNPHAISGDEVAARLGFHLAARRSEPAVTGSISQPRAAAPPQRLRPSAYASHKPVRELPDAVPGEDGED